MKILNQQNSKPSSKSTTNFEEDSIQSLFNKKREIEFKKKFYIKFTLCLLLTNILTYQLASPVIPVEEAKKQSLYTTAGQHLLKLPILLKFPFEGEAIASTLMTADKKVITHNAKIIKRTETETSIEGEDFNNYIISIPKDDLHKFVALQNQIILAYPKRADINLNGGPYEISF